MHTYIRFTFDSREIKWFFQRLFRGWSDADLWCLDYHLAKYIYPRLRAFVKSKRNGHFDNGGKWSSRDWEDVLKKMLKAFEILIKEDSPFGKYEIQQEGFELFGKYFSTLWD